MVYLSCFAVLMIFVNLLCRISEINYSRLQYHRQLWAGGRLKSLMNSAQSGDLLKDFSQ